MASEVERSEAARRDFLRRQADLFRAGFSFSGFERDFIAWNRGDGTFLEVSGITGADFPGDGRGAVYADFDNDGDLDIFVTGLHGDAHLLCRNEIGDGGPFVRVTLTGTKSGRDAFGAEARLRTRRGTLTRIKSGGSGFVSQSDPRLHFGLGADPAVEWLEVRWPSGLVQRFAGPEPGRSVEIVEGEAVPREVAERRFRLPDPDPVAARFSGLATGRGEDLRDLPVRTLEGVPVLGGVLPMGRPALLVFWATWCTLCPAEMAALEDLAGRAGDRGPALIGISVDGPDLSARVREVVDRAGYRFPIYAIGAGGAARIWGATDVSVPLAILVDGAGRAADVFAGRSREARRRLEALFPPP